jgi:hypothetical protein
MRVYPPWAVLAPGEPTWLEERARAALGMDEEGEENVESTFTIAPGGSHYHALMGLDADSVGDEMLIAEKLSRECTEPVYSILDMDMSESPLVFSYRNGVSETLEVESQELAQSLGCPFPEEEEIEEEARRPLKSAALVEGVLAQEALRVLEEEEGHPIPPGQFRLEDTPKGLLITDGIGGMGFADITLSERFPRATVYAVTASPSLDIFIVAMFRGEEDLGQFSQPPREGFSPPVSEIKGERTPERILAALGIPAEWFQP